MTICHIGCLYKVIFKLLVKRISKVIGKLVTSYQTAFIPKRKIFDGVLVTNEILDYAKTKRECMLFKADFQQSYDCVNWNFLRMMLRKTGSGHKWMEWWKYVYSQVLYQYWSMGVQQ